MNVSILNYETESIDSDEGNYVGNQNATRLSYYKARTCQKSRNSS